MKKASILPMFSLTLMVIAISLFWFSSNFEPIVYDRENVVFQIPKNIAQWLLVGAGFLSLGSFYLLWQKRCFECQDNMFIEKSDFFISLFITIFLSFIPIFILLVASFVVINGYIDYSSSYQIQNAVIDKNKHHSSRNGTTYWLTLKNNQNLIYLPVKEADYEKANYNDKVVITAKKGLLNMTWRQSYQIIPKS